MKRIPINRDEFPARRSGGHRVRMWINENKFNRQLISNFNNLYR